MERLALTRLALLVILLFMPMVAGFMLFQGNPDILLRDVLFLVGVLFLVLGAQSGEYIWNFIRNWKKIRKEASYQTELLVGLSLLSAGATYIAVAMFFP